MISRDDIEGFSHDKVNKDKIKIVEIVEHEDGSAYVSMTMDPEVYAKVFSAGFIHLIMKGIKDVKD
jgi:hypothetical protein